MINRIIVADAKEGLLQLGNKTADMCITSPPYYGLRDYGINGQIGHEKSPDEYIDRLLEVFREVWRVLRDDGTLWVVIGDSYSGSSKGGGDPTIGKRNLGGNKYPPRVTPGDCKPKDLIGIPWLLAFALRADGWYLRQDIIWYKSNPMPESVKDRCTSSHEHILLLSKSRRYFYDNEAIKETAVSTKLYKFIDNGIDKQRGHSRRHAGFNGRYAKRIAKEGTPTHRNRRDVWTIATHPYKGAHFSVFPPDLVRPCILAGSRIGGIVLDPFIGSGTTAVVAIEEERNYIGIELSQVYAALAEKRIRDTPRQIKFHFDENWI